MKNKTIIHILPWSPDSINFRKNSEKRAVIDPSHFFIKEIYDYQSHHTKNDIYVFQLANYSSDTIKFFKNNNHFHIFFPQKFFKSKYFGWQISILLLIYLYKMKPLIIHYHGFLNNRIFYFIIALINKFLIKSKLIIHHRSYQRFPKILEIFINLAYLFIDIIFVQNKTMLKNLKNKIITCKSNIYHIPNGLDMKVFNPIDQQRARNLIGLGKEPIFLLWISRFAKDKQPLTILKILKELQDLNKDIKLIMIGDGILRNEILKFIKLNNLKEKIILKYWLNQNELSKFYSACDIFISTSIKAGFSNAILEAMYHSLPIIAIKNQGNMDLVTEDNGILTENEHNQILKAILDLYNNEEKRLDMSQYSKKLSNKYIWNNINKKIIKIYNNLTNNNIYSLD